MRIVFFGASNAVPGVEAGSNTSFLIAGNEGTVLVDCSGDPTLHLDRAGVSVHDLDAVILTHAHTDHVYALPSLLEVMHLVGRDKPMILAGNGPTLDFARQLLALFNLVDREGMPELVWTDIEAAPTQTLAGYRFDFYQSRHPKFCHGFACSDGRAALVYGADGAPDPDMASRRPDGPPPVLIHETTGPHNEAGQLNPIGHSTAHQAGESAARLGAGRLFLVHLGATTAEDLEALRREAQDAAGGIPVEIPAVDHVYEV